MMPTSHPVFAVDWHDTRYCPRCDTDRLMFCQSHQGHAWAICGVCGYLDTTPEDE